MFDTLYAQIGAVFVIGICVFAFLKGDDPERIGAGAYSIGWLASLLTQYTLHIGTAQYGILALDVAMLVILAALTWKSRRTCPIWAAALQLVSVMSNALVMIDPRTPLASLFTILNLTGYGVLICIAVGTFWAWQERKASRGIE